jgi:hypothetical protein
VVFRWPSARILLAGLDKALHAGAILP